MSFTAEEVSSKIGVSTIKIDSRTLETVNEISTKYPPKIFNLDMLDAKWKTFTFRNKIKNMNNITPSHLIKFFKQIDDQCKQQQISMIIDDDNNLDKPFLSSKKEEMGDKRSLETLTATEENDLKRIKTEDEHADMNQYQGKFVKEEEDVNQIKKDKISFNPMFKNKMKENVKTSDSLSDETKVLKELTYNISSPKYNDSIKIVSDSNSNGSFKIFRESTTTLSKFLDTQLSTKESVYEKYEIADPTVQSQSAIYSIGRIVNDSVTELEPIFEKSNLALETSRKVGIGRRIKIDIGNLTEGDLFLGQVILCKGRNVTGEEFIIDEIIKAENSSTKDEEMDVEDTKDFKICSINGPLCADSSLDHTVFSKFIEKLNTSIQPDYLIINGPLLDITNKCISSGIIPPIITKLADGSEIIENVETLEDIFQKLIKPLLAKISQTTKILLVPHATDTISKYTSYPQPSYNAKLFEDMRNVYLLPNPGFVEINGLKIIINNIDIFKNIKTVDLQSTTRKNKFKLVTELMIENESAYPLYPTIPSMNEKTSSNKRFNDMFDIPENHDFGKGNIAWMLGSSKQRINKNINSQIQTNLPETFKDGVDMVIHNSGFVPHLETISEQGCTINTNGFYNGDKLGFYSEISVSKQNVDVKIIKL